jgi:glycosyltransferase involved in cell wall biosynthesis
VKSLNRYNKIFSISTAVQTDIWNSSKLKSEVIYNGIDLAVIKSKEQYLYDPTKDFRIVQVGRLEHLIKGQHFSIQAIAKLKALGYNNLKLYLVGNGSSRPYLKDLVHSLKAEDSILFLGEKDRSWIYNNLFDFDLMIQPSIKEGFGLTIVEGVAAGIPVIATKADGPLEVLKDCPSGFLFDSEDVDELVYLIRYVIDLTRAQKIKNLCMYSKTTANKFSINYTAAKYIQQY